MERAEAELPLSQQAELLSVSRASLYYQPRLPSAEEVQLKHRIDEIYTQYPFYGARKIAAQLQREGIIMTLSFQTKFKRLVRCKMRHAEKDTEAV